MLGILCFQHYSIGINSLRIYSNFIYEDKFFKFERTNCQFVLQKTAPISRFGASTKPNNQAEIGLNNDLSSKQEKNQ